MPPHQRPITPPAALTSSPPAADDAPPATAPPLSPAERDAVDRALAMYREGWFPMAQSRRDRRAEWVQPRERCLIPLDPAHFHVSGTLRARVRSGRFVITTDRAFPDVIRACAHTTDHPQRDETWINLGIERLFTLLHRAGHAHSVEAWLVPASLPAPATPGTAQSPVLVGGLYGLALGRVFCGESMFSRPALGGTDASKACLVHLVHHLRRRGFAALDAQLENPHLTQFGARLTPMDEYGALLRAHAGTEHETPWLPWEPERTIEELVSA